MASTQIQQQLAERAHLETALPMPRLLGEVTRTTGQLRVFAALSKKAPGSTRASIPRCPTASRSLVPICAPCCGRWAPSSSSAPATSRWPFPSPAETPLRRLPPAVRSSSKHTPPIPEPASWLPKSCSKPSPQRDLPEGVFSLLFDAGIEVGVALVRHPLVQAVAFTGSLRAGRALMDLAAARPRPIPCFTEMASCNPVFILPGALKDGAEGLAQGLFNSFTLGAGQMCTKPGIVLLPEQPEAAAFTGKLSELVTQAAPFTLLTPGIARDYARLSSHRATQATLEAQAPASEAAPACPRMRSFYHYACRVS
jgi:alpha-ketoglutaric semialdehyde dehydrogenase